VGDLWVVLWGTRDLLGMNDKCLGMTL